MLTITNKNGVFYASDEEASIAEVELKIQNNGWAKLPANNSSNRTWIKESELAKIIGSKELPYHEKSIRAGTGIGKKTWVDFLDETDRATYEALKAKGEQAREEAKRKPLTEEEKQARRIAKLEAELLALRAKKQEKKGE